MFGDADDANILKKRDFFGTFIIFFGKWVADKVIFFLRHILAIFFICVMIEKYLQTEP